MLHLSPPVKQLISAIATRQPGFHWVMRQNSTRMMSLGFTMLEESTLQFAQAHTAVLDGPPFELRPQTDLYM